MTAATTALLALALSALEVRLEPGVAYPGDVILVEVSGTDEPPSGQLGAQQMVFLRFKERWLALVGLSVDQAPASLSLDVKSAEGARLMGSLEVQPANFRKRQLTVSKRFTSPSKKEKQRMAADQHAFAEALDRDFSPWNFNGHFAWPRLDDVTAPFGDLRLLNGKKQSQHFGTDINGDTGAPVFASNDGEVVLVRDCFASGNTVLVHHGGRLFSAYFHLSAFAVKEGQKVRRGERLGAVGKTGRVTGPHLHFGFKLDGRWVNPESVLRLGL